MTDYEQLPWKEIGSKQDCTLTSPVDKNSLSKLIQVNNCEFGLYKLI